MIRPGVIRVALWLIVLCLAIGVIARTPFTTDMSAFLPATPQETQQILVDQLKDGVASRLILVGIEGVAPKTLGDISRHMAASLRPQAEFASVANGAGDETATDRQFVWNNRYLLSPTVTADAFTEAGLHHALERDLQLLSSGFEPMIKASLTSDPTGETLTLIRQMSGDAHPQLREGVWMSADGTRALLLFQTRAMGFDIDAQEAALSDIGHAFESAQSAAEGGSAARLIATGPGVFGVKTRAQMKHDVSLYSTIATSAIVILLLVIYRSILVLSLTLVPVVSGALAGIAAVSLTFGFVHGITIGFGVTLIGEAVDYAIYLFAQTEPGGTPRSTLSRIWPTLRLGVLVSICGFAAMLFSSFTGFVQLGIFTITGLATALTVTRYVLPSLIPSQFAGIRHMAMAAPLLRLSQGMRKLRWVVVGIAGIAVIMLTLKSNTMWEDDLASMSPIPAADQQLDRDLRRDIGAPDVRFVAVATAVTQEEVLQAAEHAAAILSPLVTQNALSGYDAPSRYLPSEAAQVARQAAVPETATLQHSLTAALVGLPFQPGSFEPFIRDAAAAKTAPLLTRASLDNTALSLKLDSLLTKRPTGWAAILPLRGVTDPARVASAFTEGAAAGVKLIDVKEQSDRLLELYRREALTLSLLGSAAITILLLLHFRALRPTLSVLAPLGVAVIMTLALLTAGSHKLSIFNLFGLLLVVAVGSNYCLFFQLGKLSGREGERTITSLLLANLCTVIGFGALSISSIPVLSGLGGTVAMGTAITLVAAAILAPGDRI
jgi:predicted exporter